MQKNYKPEYDHYDDSKTLIIDEVNWLFVNNISKFIIFNWLIKADRNHDQKPKASRS